MNGAIIGEPPGRDLRNGTFTVGNSERAAKRRRIAARLEALLADYNQVDHSRCCWRLLQGT